MLLLTSQLHGVSGQAYHFSKGWAAGKRATGASLDDGSPSLSSARHPGRGSVGDVVAQTGVRRPQGVDDRHPSDLVNLEKIGQRINELLLKEGTERSQCKVRPEVNAVIEQLIQVGWVFIGIVSICKTLGSSILRCAEGYCVWCQTPRSGKLCSFSII